MALHLAYQSLKSGESDLAIVGGSSLLCNPEMFLFLSGQNFLSPDGKCKTFDASGDGYGRGEGFAAVVLKRVADAIVACDPIRAVIRGTGSNQDGHTKGFTLPSADAQADLITQVYKNAGLNFSDTVYVEAHGTGTQAGDVEETKALSRTISGAHSPSNKLLVGSVKSNVGSRNLLKLDHEALVQLTTLFLDRPHRSRRWSCGCHQKYPYARERQDST